MQSTELTRRSLLGAISGSIVLAGCTGDDGDDGSGNDDGGTGNGDDDGSENGDTGGTENGDDDGSGNDDGGSGNGDDDGSGNGDDDGSGNGDEQQEVVQVVSHEEHGDILAGPDGLTLYMFDSDERGSGESTCSGDCANAWPPLTVEGEPTAGPDVEAELSTIEREDGTTQVAANGWPLYYFANDGSQGDATGQGVNDVWWVLAPDGTPIRGSDEGDGSDDSNEGDGGGDDGDDGGGDGDDGGDDGDDGNGGGGDPGPY